MSWQSPEPAELVLRAMCSQTQHSAWALPSCHSGCTLPWVPECPHRILLLLRTVLSSALLFSHWHLHSWRILQKIWFCFGTGREVRVQMDQLEWCWLCEGFARYWRQCTEWSVHPWRSVCQLLPCTDSAQTLCGCLTKSAWGWMWSMLNGLEVKRSVTVTWWLQFGSHSHGAFLCVSVTAWGESFQETSSSWKALSLSKSKGWLERGQATFSAWVSEQRSTRSLPCRRWQYLLHLCIAKIMIGA